MPLIDPETAKMWIRLGQKMREGAEPSIAHDNVVVTAGQRPIGPKGVVYAPGSRVSKPSRNQRRIAAKKGNKA